MTTTETTTRTRTNWTDELYRACCEYEQTTGRALVASTMLFPASPGIVIRVDNELPRSFGSAKDAARAIAIWTHAPGAARKESSQ